MLDQGVRDHPQRLHGVLTEPLGVLLVLHLILVIEDEEGLSVGIRRVPELEGRATLAWELLLRPHERELYEVRPPGGHLCHVTIWRHRGPRLIRGVDHLDVRLLLPLIRWGIVRREVDHGRRRPLGRKWPPASRCLHLSVGRWRGHLPLCLNCRPLRLA
jgi:hypothetical protein